MPEDGAAASAADGSIIPAKFDDDVVKVIASPQPFFSLTDWTTY